MPEFLVPKAVLDLLMDSSRIAANRVLKRKREDVIEEGADEGYDGERYIQVRYLNDTKLNIFKSFKISQPDFKISKSKFYTLIPKHFKKACKKTDMCEVCVEGKTNFDNLRRIQREIHNDCMGNCFAGDVELCEREVTEEDKNRLEQLKEKVAVYISHQRFVEARKLGNFKENLRLGEGPVETGKTYFSKQQCSCLGMVLLSPDGQKEYFDFFSENLSHDTLHVKDCLDILFSKISLEGFETLEVWTDCGPHFKCQELAHYLLREFPVKYIKEVQWNFFAEYHGKSWVDGHFDLLSRWFSSIESTTGTSNIDSLIQSFEDRLQATNDGREQAKKLSIKFFR
ncbi:uncharacterized protein VTP21DRAFT_1034 [Calcarisporiella thermophila]|uniref:uncharacterized protein n=1 Tax=Calcarisporiella thermophila TaxID=911321 RepID=UPI003742D924